MTDTPEDKRPHRLEDHLLGLDPMHSHEDGEADHDHDHDDVGGEYDPTTSSLWLQDNITLLSVGIDIGSAGTQVMFSRVHLRRLSEELTSRYFVVGRETVYQSPVALTPYLSEDRIDDQGIGHIIDSAYEAAGVHPDNVDTGAVILTGEALRRENAKAIADVLAEVGGEFVCAAAGHHMESMLAAYGSGAAKVSHDRAAALLNVDIGGGTTKLALVEAGKVVHTAAIHLGGRLAVIDAEGRLTRLDPAGKRLAALAGCDWNLGDRVSEDELRRVASWMADALLRRAHGGSGAARSRGVVADGATRRCGRHRRRDVLGRRRANTSTAARNTISAISAAASGRRSASVSPQGGFPFPLLPAGECIRATALGASEYSVQLSGNTVYISSPGELLPRKNLQVIQPPVGAGRHDRPVGGRCRDPQPLSRFRYRRGRFGGGARVPVARRTGLRPPGRPSPAGILEALPRTLAAGKPLFVVLDGDVAHTLGALLKDELGVASEVLVLDGISLWDFDYIDLGRVRMPSFTVPVTIKSLVFNEDPRVPHRARQPSDARARARRRRGR